MAFFRFIFVLVVLAAAWLYFFPKSLDSLKSAVGLADKPTTQAEQRPLDLQKQFLQLPPKPSQAEMKKEVAGDAVPPEVHSAAEAEPTKGFFYTPAPLPAEKKLRKGKGKPVLFEKKKIGVVPFYLITVDMKDPESYIAIFLPNKATEANNTRYTAGHETFESFVKHYPAAAMINGTFFSKDQQERVMGNMVSEGKFLKYSQWENYGTTLSIGKGDQLEMVTARDEGKPNWDEKWFSLTCGPRLLKHGEQWIQPELEGFADPHVLGAGPRCAIGFSKGGDKLFLVNFMRGLTLKEEAQMMKSIGCYEAMNLDGGASKSISSRQNVLVKPGRPLTNVIAIFDAKNKAPASVAAKWEQFQSKEARATPLLAQ